MEDEVLNSFFGSAKRIFKQNSLNRYYFTYHGFLESFLVTATTTQGVRFHQ